MTRSLLAFGMVLTVLLATACNSASSTAQPEAAPTAAPAVARTSAVPVGSDLPPVVIAEIELSGVAESTLLEGWGDLSLAVGEPVQITANGSLPEGGVRLTRTYTRPLAAGQSATWAFFDEELDDWRAVPSTLSEDRRSLTAVVAHLSIWTDIVGWVGDKGSAAADWAGDKALQVADWSYYQVGKVFDVRVSPPECTDTGPDWLSESVFIPTHRNNPILFCTGRDENQPELLVVKARANRGYAFQITAPGEHAWDYNSSYQKSDMEQAWSAIADLGDTFADSFTQLVSPDGVVAPGAEYSFALTESAARDLEANRALVLTPPDPAGFLMSTLGQLVGAEVGLLADGYAAAAIAVAGCTDRLAGAHDGGTWANAITTCLTGIDEEVAQALASYFLQRGMPATEAGKLAGRIVGKVTVYLALIGPVFSTINYGLELSTTPDARTVWIHPTVVADVSTSTLLGAEVPATCELPSQRLTNGQTTEGSPGQGWLQADEGQYGFVDLAGLGYKQGLIGYLCSAGGVSWPEHLLLVGRGGNLLASYDLGDIGQREHAQIESMTVGDAEAVIEWSSYEGAGFYMVRHRSVVTYKDGHLHLSDTITEHSAEAVLADVIDAVVLGDRGILLDQAVIDDTGWAQLVAFARGQDGIGSHCEGTANTVTCQIIFSADYGGGYYAVLEEARNAYGWRVVQAGQGM